MPRLAASQNGLVHSLGTGIGRVTLLQSLIRPVPSSFASLGCGIDVIRRRHQGPTIAPREVVRAPAGASAAAAFRRRAWPGLQPETPPQARIYQAPPPRSCIFL